MTKILVTGSGGVLGSTFALQALKKVYSDVGLDNYNNSSPINTSLLRDESKNFFFKQLRSLY